MYSQIKSCVFLVCFTIMNRISYVQIAMRKINKKYNISSLVPSFLKYKKPSTNQETTFLINSNDKLTLQMVDDIKYYKLTTKDNSDITAKPCNYSFSSISLSSDDLEKDLDINISDNDFNYYCVDNIINSDFLSWYVNKYYNTALLDKYTLSIIDNNCDMFDLEKSQSILLEEEKYTII